MSYNWAEYYDLAVVLKEQRLQSGVPDAALRSAISRAYYASFCSARRYISTNATATLPRDGTVHQKVIDHFLTEGHRTNDHQQVTLGRTLRKLRGQRNQADYADRLPRLHDEAQKAINRASSVLGLLRSKGWSP